MIAPVVEVHDLTKSFGPTPVLRGVELRLYRAVAAMIIGGNGSGKSTLLRLLCGLSRPTSGTVTVFGEDSRNLGAAHRKRIGILTHQSWLYPNLTARENLEYFAALYGLRDADALAAKWIDQVGLSAAADERVRGFSRGMEQRLALARAMLAAPDLLLLDEPFAALDPEGVARVSGLIRAQLSRGCSVLVTAHAVLDLGVEVERFEVVRGRILPGAEAERKGGRLRSLFGI